MSDARIGRLRREFPALGSGTAFFDSPGGTQTPSRVIEAMAESLRNPLSNRGTLTRSQRNAEATVRDARRAVADFVNGDPEGVVFGRSATQLTFDLARTLATGWRPGAEVVLTRLDHDANIRPWVRAAETVGATVRWVDFDPATGDLPTERLADQLSARTVLVALTAASNLIGTRPDVPVVAELTHDAGALLWVDGVHYAAHALVDVHQLGCDFFVCSPYKFFGPHLGALVAAPSLLEGLRPDKLMPASDAVPERFELGTLPYELLAGTAAAIDFVADLAEPSGPRRQRLVTSHGWLDQHERHLRHRLEDGLRDLGATLYSRAADRTPTVLIDLPRRRAADVAAHLASAEVNAPAGHFYALEASRRLGLGDGGAVRAGITAYNDETDVDRLLAALTTLR